MTDLFREQPGNLHIFSGLRERESDWGRSEGCGKTDHQPRLDA